MKVLNGFLCAVALFFISLFSESLIAQEDFYDINHIPEIRVTFFQENWDEILDQFYIDGLEERLLCDVEIDGTLIEGAGIRYKGFSSVSVNYTKNPFNIKLDYTYPDSAYQGYDKIKLSNVIQDPSFVREALSYEIARNYMPAGKANFAKLFINGEYWGLYTNVEAVNKSFLSQHFQSTDGPFFKCNPEELELFGENANLSNSPGTSPEDYYELYSIKSDDGWEQLVNFIATLNENPTEIEPLLNIDRSLWMHALNYSFINFDSYVGYGQNFYVYQDENGQFNPILWDMNMSFGSFRLTDGSEYFDGFNIEQAKTIDPLTHLNNTSVFPRPLMRNLLENSTYELMYLAHMRTIFDEYFYNNFYAERAESMQSLIDEDVLADVNKFYSYDDFINNLNSTVTDFIDYPGITDLMDARAEYLASYPGFANSPDITGITNSPEELELGGTMAFTCNASSAAEVFLYHRSDSGLFQKVEMVNSGGNEYEISLENTSNFLEYYFYAQNEEAGRFSPERAAYEFYALQSQINPEYLVINEFSPLNTADTDEFGEFDDWIELYNRSGIPISTAGLYLSDEEDNPTKWALPNLTLGAGEYAIIWADEQGAQGSSHANFKLSSLGEFISLAFADGTYIDSYTYLAAEAENTFARLPNGAGPFVLNTPTLGFTNDPVSVTENMLPEFSIYPNPASSNLNIYAENRASFQAELYSPQGNLVKQKSLSQTDGLLDISNLSAGIYLLKLKTSSGSVHRKIIVQ
ncbi:MAG: CotH kinase family protein [Flavobacteriales bacterium]